MAWNPSDAVMFREYLNNNRHNLISHLMELTPSVEITNNAKVEGVALQGAFKEGYQSAIALIQQLSIPPNRQDDATAGGFSSM